MTCPKHKRCRTCGQVTSRYVRTERTGAATLVVWQADPVRGEVLGSNGAFVWCKAHAPTDVAAFVAAFRRPA